MYENAEKKERRRWLQAASEFKAIRFRLGGAELQKRLLLSLSEIERTTNYNRAHKQLPSCEPISSSLRDSRREAL
jgi:hypothetical protein